MTHEINYLNHIIVLPDITGPSQTEREKLSGHCTSIEDIPEKPVSHQLPEQDIPERIQEHKKQESYTEPGSQSKHGDHGDGIIIHIDGEEVMVHQIRPGRFHTHALPYLIFNNLEDLAKAVVNHMELGRYHGHSQESKQADNH